MQSPRREEKCHVQLGMSISEEWLEKDETDAEFHVSKAQCYGDSLQTSNVSELITVGNFESADKIYLNVPY